MTFAEVSEPAESIEHIWKGVERCSPVLRSCVPDSVHTKTKMMYAAVCDDIKRALGLTRFAPNYHVVDAEDWSDRAGAITATEHSAVADILEQVQEERGGLFCG